MRCTTLYLAGNVATGLGKMPGRFDDYLGSRMGRADWRSDVVARWRLGMDCGRATWRTGWMDIAKGRAQRNSAADEAVSHAGCTINRSGSGCFKP